MGRVSRRCQDVATVLLCSGALIVVFAVWLAIHKGPHNPEE